MNYLIIFDLLITYLFSFSSGQYLRHLLSEQTDIWTRQWPRDLAEIGNFDLFINQLIDFHIFLVEKPWPCINRTPVFHPQKNKKNNNFSGVSAAPMFFTLKINKYIDHFIFWSRCKYICTLTLYGTKWPRYQHAYSHVRLISSNSLILIFKKLKRESRGYQEVFIFLSYFLILERGVFLLLEKGRKGFHTGIIHISCGFVALKRAVWVCWSFSWPPASPGT